MGRTREAVGLKQLSRRVRQSDDLFAPAADRGDLLWEARFSKTSGRREDEADFSQLYPKSSASTTLAANPKEASTLAKYPWGPRRNKG